MKITTGKSGHGRQDKLRFDLQIVPAPQRMAMLENKMRYFVVLNGERKGELYYNMTGYRGALPTPDGKMLDIGERPITEWRREVARLRREFREGENLKVVPAPVVHIPAAQESGISASDSGGAAPQIPTIQIRRADNDRIIFEAKMTWPHELKTHAENLGEAVKAAISEGVDLSGADLSEAELAGADLSGARMSGALLAMANLRSAQLSKTDFAGADLSGANLRDANMVGANLEGADLDSADMTMARLASANMTGAKLNETEMTCAMMRETILADVDLSAVDVSVANIRNTQDVIAVETPDNLCVVGWRRGDVLMVSGGNVSIPADEAHRIWSENPDYIHLLNTLDRIEAIARERKWPVFSGPGNGAEEGALLPGRL